MKWFQKITNFGKNFISGFWSILKALGLISFVILGGIAPKLIWDVEYKGYLDLIRIIAWPIVVLVAIFFFRKVFTYLFLSLREFNFFGNKGQLRDVNEVIQNEVDKRIEQKNKEEKDQHEAEEVSRKLTEMEKTVGATEKASELIKIAKDLYDRWEKSQEEVRKLTYENKKHSSEKIGIVPGSLIKGETLNTVYWYGRDCQRYSFPDVDVLKSWFPCVDETAIQLITDRQLADIVLAGNMVYRAGTRIIKIASDEKIYAVGQNGMIHWIHSTEVIENIFGSDWKKLLVVVKDVYFVDYSVGRTINHKEDFDPVYEQALAQLP